MAALVERSFARVFAAPPLRSARDKTAMQRRLRKERLETHTREAHVRLGTTWCELTNKIAG